MLRGSQLGTANIQRNIFQGDSLSSFPCNGFHTTESVITKNEAGANHLVEVRVD